MNVRSFGKRVSADCSIHVSKRLTALPLRLGTGEGACSYHSFRTALEAPAGAIRQEKKIKGTQI